MSGGQGDDVGGAYLETQQAMGQICCENRPILVLFLPFSASVCFRLLPPASASFRFGSHLVRVSDGNVDGAMEKLSGDHI